MDAVAVDGGGINWYLIQLRCCPPKVCLGAYYEGGKANSSQPPPRFVPVALLCTKRVCARLRALLMANLGGVANTRETHKSSNIAGRRRCCRRLRNNGPLRRFQCYPQAVPLRCDTLRIVVMRTNDPVLATNWYDAASKRSQPIALPILR